ncbi:DUF1707 domain-containing protein [Actinomadura rubrisoli]|uniref:DUF1707 domain-containing protein n=2 Tax=Actinomadura rubrisoli TaxID=2530368 RepID=A0A4R4ZTC9_9ACTN|nr:DUF1707 domain-containing protein [Actinomadura rubrisoli]
MGADGAGAGGRVRASDGDRDAAIEHLGDALAEGALDAAEYDRRLERAVAAATCADLAALTGDLPVSRAALARAEKARGAARALAARREWFDEWGHWAGGAVIMTVIWAVTSLRAGEWRFFWPVVPLGIWAAVLITYAVWPSREDR